MTFLELVQRYRQEIGGARGSSGPVTVVGQVGELKRAVDNVADAWVKIQNLHPNWKFQRQTTTWTSTAGQATYTLAECGIAAGTFGHWLREPLRYYVTASGLNTEQRIFPTSYDCWRETWNFSANRSVTSYPHQWAETPTKGIAFGPAPVAGLTFSAEYYRGPVRLTASSDVPLLPEPHDHMLIVWYAMKNYARFETAPEVYAQAVENLTPMLTQLRNDQLPRPSLAGALA
jgi:hypothetical protein